MVTVNVRPVGAFLREQRRTAQASLRDLAAQAGAPGVYLSQLEHGLRKPGAEVLQQVAKGLRVSADQLSAQAGALAEREVDERAVESAVLADGGLSERHKRVLIELYHSFRSPTTARATGRIEAGDGAEKADAAGSASSH